MIFNENIPWGIDTELIQIYKIDIRSFEKRSAIVNFGFTILDCAIMWRGVIALKIQAFVRPDDASWAAMTRQQ